MKAHIKPETFRTAQELQAEKEKPDESSHALSGVRGKKTLAAFLLMLGLAGALSGCDSEAAPNSVETTPFDAAEFYGSGEYEDKPAVEDLVRGSSEWNNELHEYRDFESNPDRTGELIKSMENESVEDFMDRSAEDMAVWIDDRIDMYRRAQVPAYQEDGSLFANGLNEGRFPELPATPSIDSSDEELIAWQEYMLDYVIPCTSMYPGSSDKSGFSPDIFYKSHIAFMFATNGDKEMIRNVIANLDKFYSANDGRPSGVVGIDRYTSDYVDGYTDEAGTRYIRSTGIFNLGFGINEYRVEFIAITDPSSGEQEVVPLLVTSGINVENDELPDNMFDFV